MKVLGIMSGTSLDGIDYVLCEITAKRIEFVRHWQRTFPPALRSGLEEAARGILSTHALGQLHHDLGRHYAVACPGIAGLELAGLHGQTVFHDAANRATLQIGEAAWLAERLGVPVVSNFRSADLAAGGQGAPLATLFHQRVFGKKSRHICVNNLGGISNVTSIDHRSEARIMAFDTGPANMLLDMAIKFLTDGRQSFDEDGARAARGTPNHELVQKWLKHPFFRKKPPKSTGREEFGEVFFAEALRDADRRDCQFDNFLATLALFAAESVLLNYRLHLPGPPDEIVLTGGGAFNSQLVALIAGSFREWNSSISVVTCQERGWNPETVEAAAFALLAYRTWQGLPANLPSTTGAKHAAVLGQISYPCAARRTSQ